MTERGGRREAFKLAAGVFALDRLTKWLAENYLSSSEALVVIPGFFNLLRTENRGAAFSLLAGVEGPLGAGLLIVLSTLAVLAISIVLWRTSKSAYKNPSLRFGLALILGGALGNLFDRVVRGAVIDFAELYAGSFHWPAFNVADAAITLGAFVALLDMWRARSSEPGS